MTRATNPLPALTEPHTVLVTGGTGYIGAHACAELLKAGARVVIIDNLCNSEADVVRRIERTAGRPPLAFHCVDVRDTAEVARVLAQHRVDSVIHFAGLKAVGDSTSDPLSYYDVNVTGTVSLLSAMNESGVRRLVFSSSATVYGEPEHVPIRESHPVSPCNPYGRTKLAAEQILRDLAQADPAWHIALLRYFNPIGADAAGLLGEQPRGTPNNLMPYITQVATGQRSELCIFGNDYPTPDGTGIRDYVHVSDLAEAHVAALRKLSDVAGAHCVNLGTGIGYSVLQVLAAFEEACGQPIPTKFVARRRGDVAACFADPSLAQRWLGWRARRDLRTMCADAWRFASRLAANSAVQRPRTRAALRRPSRDQLAAVRGARPQPVKA